MGYMLCLACLLYGGKLKLFLFSVRGEWGTLMGRIRGNCREKLCRAHHSLFLNPERKALPSSSQFFLSQRNICLFYFNLKLDIHSNDLLKLSTNLQYKKQFLHCPFVLCYCFFCQIYLLLLVMVTSSLHHHN